MLKETEDTERERKDIPQPVHDDTIFSIENHGYETAGTDDLSSTLNRTSNGESKLSFKTKYELQCSKARIVELE